MTRFLGPRCVLTILAVAGVALLSACGPVGRGMSTTGNAVTNTSGSVQQTIHDTTGAAKQ